ncbi:MAG: FG-GAP repeat protein [Planctomycetota bacterium]
MLRTLALELAACLSLLAPLAQGQSDAAHAVGEATGASAESARDLPDAVDDELSSDDWASIRAAYEAKRYEAFADDGEYRARNPGQRWTTHFDGRGFTTRPDAGDWTWGLELEAYGWDAAEPVVATSAAVTTNGQRVSYDWDERLTEWYVNDRRGLEHGYTVHARPESASGALVLELAVRGDLLPVVSATGRDVRFVDATGGAVLTYAGLTVFDADGEPHAAGWEVVGERLRLRIEDQAARYPLTIDPIAQQAYLKASNTDASDRFGHSVAVSGDTVVVGAPGETSSATGVDGDQSSNDAFASGAVYVFVRNGTTWAQEAYLKASNAEALDQFGESVAVCGDTVVVGALGEASSATGVDGDQSSNDAFASGAVYVFVRNGTTWAQEAYLKASNAEALDQFGESVAVCGDTVVVGALGEDSSATGVNGDESSQSAHASGAAYVFVRSGTTWSQEAYLKASNTGTDEFFGSSVAVSGDTVVVGALNEDSAATGVNGDESNNAASNSGAAYVFVRSGTTWSQEAYLKASNTEASDRFGYSVAVSGETVVVGAHLEDSAAAGVNGDQTSNAASISGAAYVFVRSGTTWSQEAYLKASNTGAGDVFGSSVAVSGDTVVVGAYHEDSAATGVDGDQSSNTATWSGAAYVFVRSGTTWSQEAYLKASNTGTDDFFGISVAISGDTIVVGASDEHSAATGVNGDQSSNAASQSGAAYVFELGLAAASCSARDGILGLNPPDYTCTSLPKIGTTWTSEIATTPLVGLTTNLTFVAIGLGGPVQGFQVFGFELLALPPFDPLLVSGTGSHSFFIPNDLTLVGIPVATQGLRMESTGSTNHFVLTNALDLVLGY